MQWFERHWYQRHKVMWLLTPFAVIFRAITALRRGLYRFGIIKPMPFTSPLIVVGNITVGGTGKTPLVILLAQWCQQQGLKPGIVSRGYGGSANRSPQFVTAASDPAKVGDEAVLMAKRTHCLVVIAASRVAAVIKLLSAHRCDVALSDDGLQHYAMQRQIEIAVIDGERRFGNGFCLPAGPLREPIKRLRQVDFIVANGKAQPGEFAMQLLCDDIYQLTDPQRRVKPESFINKTIHAVTGIGHPQRFFASLKNLGLNIVEHVFPDHHLFTPQDFAFADDAAIIVTEKDAVKCQSFADQRFWCLPVTAQLGNAFFEALQARLQAHLTRQ